MPAAIPAISRSPHGVHADNFTSMLTFEVTDGMEKVNPQVEIETVCEGSVN